MKLGDRLVKALKERDTEAIGRIAKYMRFGKVRRNYWEIYEFICRVCLERGVKPPDKPDWDELLRESEGG